MIIWMHYYVYINHISQLKTCMNYMNFFFSAPQTLTRMRMMPMRRMRDKSCLGNSVKLHPSWRAPQPTNQRGGGFDPVGTLRCQAAFSGQNKYLNNLYRSEVEIPFQSKTLRHNNQHNLLLVCWYFAYIPFLEKKYRWSAANIICFPNFSATADSSLVLSPDYGRFCAEDLTLWS